MVVSVVNERLRGRYVRLAPEVHPKRTFTGLASGLEFGIDQLVGPVAKAKL